MIQYISGGIYAGLPLNSVRGTNKRENGGGKMDESFSVHFNVHTPVQIVFLNFL
jgi:hypothetical protein